MLKRAVQLGVLYAILGFAYANPWVAFPCPVRAVLRIPCPGCGMTRALGEVMHGHFAAAHALHPLVWVVAPLVLIALCIESASFVRTGEFAHLSRSKRANRIGAVLVVLLLGVWAARFAGAFGGPAPV